MRSVTSLLAEIHWTKLARLARQVDACRHLSDSGLARPASAPGVQSTLSLQTLPSSAAGRRGSRHSLASAGHASAGRPPLLAMASLTSDQSEFSELYMSADSDGLASPLPTFQTPPSTLLRGPAAPEMTAEAAAASRQVCALACVTPLTLAVADVSVYV